MNKIVSFFLLYMICSIGLIAQSTLPAYRNTNWGAVKNLSIQITGPVDSVNIMNYGGDNTGTTSNNTALSDAINYLKSTGKTGIVLFPIGTFLFSQSVELPDSIVLKGQGAGVTTFRFNTGSYNNNMIGVNGSAGTDTTTIIGTVNKGDNKIRVAAAGKFNTGDFVQLKENDISKMFSSWSYGYLGQMLQIKSITGDSIEFYNTMRVQYPASLTPFIQKVNMRRNVGISCLKIVRGNAVTDAFQHSNILFNYAYNCWLSGVISDSGHYAHVELSNSLNNVIRECYFQNAYDYGGGGRGYGIACQFASSENLIVNNVFRKLRHAMLLQSGANGNVFSYNYSRETFWVEGIFPSDVSGDIVLHGNYPFSNLLEHNIVQNIVIDNSHGNNGPYNLLFRNRAENAGIYMNSGSGDSTSFIGNEVTKAAGLFYGFYTLTGNGNFTFGNNIRGTNQPSGTSVLPDSTYYLSQRPDFITGNWPSIGYPNLIGTGSIPAYQRFANNASNPAVCQSQLVVLASGNLFLTGKVQAQQYLLNWKISSSVAYLHYLIQISSDGINFTDYKSVDVNPFNTSNNSFSIAVGNFISGRILYFRIKADLMNGTGDYSNVIHFINDKMQDGLSIYPNPVSTFLQVHFNLSVAENLGYDIVDMVGKSRMAGHLRCRVGVNQFLLDVHQLSKGMYCLKVYSYGKYQSISFIKN